MVSGASIQEPGGRGRMSTASGDLARGRSDRYRANQVLQGRGLVVVDSRESRREQERAGEKESRIEQRAERAVES